MLRFKHHSELARYPEKKSEKKVLQCRGSGLNLVSNKNQQELNYIDHAPI